MINEWALKTYTFLLNAIVKFKFHQQKYFGFEYICLVIVQIIC